ncbi:hypothetical protein PITC_081070 [Penicillium italicum]|uniref:Leucine-rich repeat domain-containing protein n=1 Tax=Penicillium italicum TaxID=40296 RepID=A0A0A2L8A6_PENIT|nr:hypothetical protein PITC_081070 [Penicillium italicum]
MTGPTAALQINTDCDSWLAVLLYLVPNIKKLDIEWGGSGTMHTERLFQRIVDKKWPSDETPMLSSPCEVHIHVPHCTGWDFDPQKLALFYRLRSMRTLKGNPVGEFDWPSQFLPPRSSLIEHLGFRDSGAEDGFKFLIALCKNLKSFKYLHHEIAGLFMEPPQYCDHFTPFRACNFTESLSFQKSTLESVIIGYIYPGDDYTPGSSGGIGSLSDYVMLKNLHLRLSNLLGLYVSDMYDWGVDTLVEELKNLVSVSEDRFPRLKTIEIEGNWEEWSKAEEEERKRSRQACPEIAPLTDKEIHDKTAELQESCRKLDITFHVRLYHMEAWQRGKAEVEDADYWATLPSSTLG